ncbi:Hypothetical predicted protein [Marmota monax]|uniref:Uncharacterized protein n=1 Tax=Marmota monax TaxID=9995 RepID=A0A5E4ATB4_MARMO|nr:Hypothetical predicted protein [Marmota monax]
MLLLPEAAQPKPDSSLTGAVLDFEVSHKASASSRMQPQPRWLRKAVVEPVTTWVLPSHTLQHVPVFVREHNQPGVTCSSEQGLFVWCRHASARPWFGSTLWEGFQ